MDVCKVITELGGDYNILIHKLKRDVMIQSFLEDFLEDEEFAALEQALADHRDEEAFSACHALKGVALNLELGSLARALIELTEALRHGRQPEADELFARVKVEYDKAVNLISSKAGV